MSGPKKRTFEELSEAIRKHRDDRNWTDNPPRGLATSIVLEAGELLEHYQWSDKPVGAVDELAEELADILIYAFQFALYYDIDIPEAMLNKLAKAAKKYPVEIFQIKDEKERNKVWLKAKLQYRKDGL